MDYILIKHYIELIELNEYVNDYTFDNIRLSIIYEKAMEIKYDIQHSFIWLFSKDLKNCFIKLTLYLNFYVVSLIVPLLISVAYLTLVERKVIGASQRRLGPNIVGLFGLGQPLADV